MGKQKSNAEHPPPARHLLAISDLHSGSRSALCPPNLPLSGGPARLNSVQRVLWGIKGELLQWLAPRLNGERFVLVANGDCLEGFHHGDKTGMSLNVSDHVKIAAEILGELIGLPSCAAAMIVRGTEAHVGKDAEHEELLAQVLVERFPDRLLPINGSLTAWQLRLRMCGHLIHCAHHVGVGSSPVSEATAPLRELVKAYYGAARWCNEAPDIIIRSHRHQCIVVSIPTATGLATAICTPAWQVATPFSHAKHPGQAPQIGAVLVTFTDDGDHWVRPFIRTLKADPEVRLS